MSKNCTLKRVAATWFSRGISSSGGLANSPATKLAPTFAIVAATSRGGSSILPDFTAACPAALLALARVTGAAAAATTGYRNSVALEEAGRCNTNNSYQERAWRSEATGDA